jgi:two-component system, cell cycle response regulator DivK
MFNILLVEDDSQHAALVMRILQPNGFEVEHVERATRGIQLTRLRTWSLIIMDLELPDMTGQAACMLIRKELLSATPPVIALTSHHEGGFRQSARQAGCQAFITKPYPPMLLLETVRHFIKKTTLADHAVLL